MHSPLDLPAGLPVPQDEGACNHLYRTRIPELLLPSTDGYPINLAQIRTVWSSFVILGPGTRINLFRKVGMHFPAQEAARRSAAPSGELTAAGASHIFGLSTQEPDYQSEAVKRLELPYPLLSDLNLKFAQALALPTFQFNSKTLIKRLTLIIDNGSIAKVFYPVFPPDKSAGETLEWLMQNRPRDLNGAARQCRRGS